MTLDKQLFRDWIVGGLKEGSPDDIPEAVEYVDGWQLERDFLAVVKNLIPFWKEGRKLKVVTNAGGLNPRACAEAIQAILQEANLTLKVGLVSGDDVLPLLQQDPSNENYCNNGENRQNKFASFFRHIAT